jgi:ubiquinone/menaquinone biosynthesis C-methylase UbiE
MRVLDAGCGPGTYHSALVGLGADVVGFDPSKGMVGEARDNARANRFHAGILQASVEHVPFKDASFERVMCNHVLYHVPDIRLALYELRRVLKPGGRAVITTNGAPAGRLFELHEEAARECGFTPTAMASTRFTLDDLPLVRSVFPGATMVMLENAFVFPDTEPVLRYYASYQVDEIEERAADGSHREPLLRCMRRLIDEVIAREGEFRSPKNAGCFVADVPV